MKKSKFLTILSLVLVMIISLVVTACGGLSVKEIQMDQNTFRGIYVVGEEIDYSKIQVIAIYEDNTKSTFKLTDDGVSYTSIDTSSVGTKEFKVTVNGYSATFIVKIASLNAVLEKIEFDSEEELVVDYKTAIDYSKIFIKAIYDDENANETIALSDSEVTILQGVETNELGKQTLIVEYKGKQASIEVEVKVLNAIMPITYAIPQSYIDFKNESAVKDDALITENEFAIKGKPYIVGNVNKFKFVPSMSYLDVSAGIVTIENPVTTYVLQLKGENGYEDVDENIYLSEVVDNMYKFTDQALGKEFKLIVSPSNEIYDLSRWANVPPTATIEFKVEKAYNVYDVYGLSVMDNLNVKNWAQIKDRTLVYDDKKLSEYTDVTLVVLHNDVSIDADKLPNNYFWSEYMPGYELSLSKAKAADNATGSALGYANKLKGSLRDGTGDNNNYNHTTSNVDNVNDDIYDSDGDGVNEDYNETTYNAVNMQKGIFNTNQCSITGNYMTITTKDSETRRLASVISRDYTTNDTLSMSNPISHWFMFKFFKTGSEELNISIENVFLQGNMPKVNQGGIPAGLMAVNSLVDTLTVDNTITSQFYSHILTDESPSAQCTVNLKNSRMIDAYSNMFYIWKSKVNVENSVLKNAGGPLFLLVDSDRAVTDNTSPHPVLNIDEKSVLESYAAGTEAWYTIFNATALFSQFKNMNNLFMNMSQLYAAQGIPTALACNKTFVHEIKEAEQINLIAVVLPNTDSILTARSNDDLVSIKGQVSRGSELYDIADPVISEVKSLGSVAFASGGQYLFMPTPSSIAPAFVLAQQAPTLAGLATVPGNFNESSNWLSVTMSASSLGVANAPYFNVIIGDFVNM